MAKNAFDAVLESLSEETRKTFGELAEREPKLKDMVLAQSDYSRRSDELRSKVEMAERWNKWRDDYWDDDKKMTKAEIAKQDRLESLERDLETARQAALGTGDQMTFEQIEQWGSGFLKDKGIVTKAALDTELALKSKTLQDYVTGSQQALGSIAAEIPYLLLKHKEEFGEVLDPKPLIAAASEKGRYDLREFYEKDYVIERRQKSVEDKHKAELDKLQAQTQEAIKARDAAEEARKAAMMGPGAGNMVDDGGPGMGPLQKKLVSSVQAEDGKGTEAPNVPLGEGSIAAFAARQFMERQAGKTA